MTRYPAHLQAIYSDLLAKVQQAEWEGLLDKKGAFSPKTVRGRRYWYYRERVGSKIKETYLGPETGELLRRMRSEKPVLEGARAAAAERRRLVRLLRDAGYPYPDQRTGRVLQTLARAGVFRLRAVLIGTHAYRLFGALIGTPLPEQAAFTTDIDIAQFKTVSLAVGDCIEPRFEQLINDVDHFLAVPAIEGAGNTYRWRTEDQGLSVELLTPMVGPVDEKPAYLPALKARAKPLLFLDYLIHETRPAVVLHRDGVLVNVPLPERYALHKLLVSQERTDQTREKSTKDILQAASLLEVLFEDSPEDVEKAWVELLSRGHRWRTSAIRGAKKLPYELAERLLPLAKEAKARPTEPGRQIEDGG